MRYTPRLALACRLLPTSPWYKCTGSRSMWVCVFVTVVAVEGVSLSHANLDRSDARHARSLLSPRRTWLTLRAAARRTRSLLLFWLPLRDVTNAKLSDSACEIPAGGDVDWLGSVSVRPGSGFCFLFVKLVTGSCRELFIQPCLIVHRTNNTFRKRTKDKATSSLNI